MILIDKPIPEDCDYCFCNDDNYRCGLLNEEFPLHLSGRLPNCPLREMEKVDDTISRQAAIDVYCSNCHGKGCKDYPCQSIIQEILDLPSAQPEAKTPTWKEEDRFVKGYFTWYPYCPKCDHEVVTGQCYCKICGQHIDWSEDDE